MKIVRKKELGKRGQSLFTNNATTPVLHWITNVFRYLISRFSDSRWLALVVIREVEEVVVGGGSGGRFNGVGGGMGANCSIKRNSQACHVHNTYRNTFSSFPFFIIC